MRLGSKTCRLTVLIVVICLIQAALAFHPPIVTAAAGAATVESVQVEVLTTAPTPPRVTRRMAESVRTIGEHLLLGHATAEVGERRQHYEKLVRDVFDRVLSGYMIESVVLEPAAVSKIQIRIAPWGDTIRQVDIQVDYSGIAPAGVSLLKKDMGKLEDDIRVALLGLPVDAVDWASGVARELIRELLRRQLPEFHFSLDVEAGQQTKVRLSLFPTGEIVREVQVSLRSKSIPNLLLVHARPAVEAQARTMRGLPVAYVERHLAYFTDQVRQATRTDPVIRQFDLQVSPAVRPQVDAEVAVNVEAETWRIYGEVYLDVGRDKDNVSGQAHVGRLIAPKDELFLEAKVLPGDLTWQFMPGWGHQFGRESRAGIRYRTNDRQWGWWWSQGLGGRWALRAERWWSSDQYEFGLRYKLHDFLSAECVFSNGRTWLRMVGHL